MLTYAGPGLRPVLRPLGRDEAGILIGHTPAGTVD